MMIDEKLRIKLNHFCESRRLNNTEAAALLGVGASTISRWRRPGFNINATAARTLEYRLNELENNSDISFEGQLLKSVPPKKPKKNGNCVLADTEGVSVEDAINFLVSLKKIAPHAVIKLGISA